MIGPQSWRMSLPPTVPKERHLLLTSKAGAGELATDQATRQQQMGSSRAHPDKALYPSLGHVKYEAFQHRTVFSDKISRHRQQ